MRILGVGNSLVDMLCRLPNEEILSKYSLPKGGMQLIDKEMAIRISNDIKHLECQFVSGGSAANTINGIANIGGVETSFLGKIGRDEVGDYFENDLRKDGVETFMLRSDLPTGRCISLISPDGERTMCTCLGATGELLAEDVGHDAFQNIDICHIGGYLVQNHDMIEQVMITAKAHGAKVSLDLASYNVVESNFDFMHYLVKNFVDICFANEEETAAYTKTRDLEEGVKLLAQDTEIAIAKGGSAGVWTMTHGGKPIFVSSLPNRNCIDTTGAGDLFASGYLYGLMTSDYNIEVAAKYGAIVGANIIEHVGTRMSADIWDSIRSEFKKV